MSVRDLVLVFAAATCVACGGAPPKTPPTTEAKHAPIELEKEKVVDADHDGILDPDDACPADAEDKDGFDDGDGCPDADNDKDGILDDVDQCPNEAEVYNGKQDDDGCPDALSVVISDPVPVPQGVRFALGSAKIPAESKSLLDTVAQMMAQNPQLVVVGIEGFADDPGGAAANVALSQKRADAVMKELVARGVDSARLRAKGFGAYCPVDSSATPEAHARNRRVNFWVLESTAGIVAEPAGCPEAKKHGLVLTP